MRVTTLRTFVHLLLFGLMLGTASTANADAVASISFSFNNFQIIPTTGSVTFTPTAASGRGAATNTLGEHQDVTNNGITDAQGSAAVTFTNATGTASATNLTANATSVTSVSGCACLASSFAQASFGTTFVIDGGQGDVLVTISFDPSILAQLSTDALGTLAGTTATYTVGLNGIPVFRKEEIFFEREGPNQSIQLQLLSGTISKTFMLQYGAPNTLDVRIGVVSYAETAVPEPASIVLLVSGFGLMTGILRRKRRQG